MSDSKPGGKITVGSSTNVKTAAVSLPVNLETRARAASTARWSFDLSPSARPLMEPELSIKHTTATLPVPPPINPTGRARAKNRNKRKRVRSSSTTHCRICRRALSCGSICSKNISVGNTRGRFLSLKKRWKSTGSAAAGSSQVNRGVAMSQVMEKWRTVVLEK